MGQRAVFDEADARDARWRCSRSTASCGTRIDAGQLAVYYQPIVTLQGGDRAASRRCSAGSIPSAGSFRLAEFIPRPRRPA